MATWVCRAGRGGLLATNFQSEGKIAIGWLDETDLGKLSRPDIIARLRQGAPAGHPSKATVPAGVMWRFVHEISLGDTVITPDGATRELLIGEVTGAYQYRAKPLITDMHHYRDVRWEGRYSRDLLPKRILYSLGSLLTLFRFEAAEEALRVLRSGGGAPLVELPDDSLAAEAPITEDTEARGQELIQHDIASLDDNALEELVAGLLRAMGYHTRVAGEGADGGIDVRAARDPLFSEGPFLKVQVKARSGTPMRPQDLGRLQVC